MGMGMALSLQRAGYAVSVHDIDPARVQLATDHGFAIAPDAATLAQRCATVFVVVVNADQIRQVLHGSSNVAGAAGTDTGTALSQGADGLLAAISAEHTVLVCSTIGPDDMASFAAAVQARGARFVDAPISGGPVRAENGTMSMMLAAPSASLQALEPMLAKITGKRFTISSRPGDASKAKLVNNLLAGIHLVAAAEAFALAKRFELDPGQMFELIRASSGQSWMLEDRAPRALSGDLQPRAAAHVITKDLTLANAAARSVGLELALGELARQAMQKTCDDGWRADDDAAVITRLMQS